MPDTNEQRESVKEARELLAKTPRNSLFVIPHPQYAAALSRINTNKNADWAEFGHVATVSPAWADLFARAPELIKTLCDEVDRLRNDLRGAEAERDAAINLYERQWS